MPTAYYKPGFTLRTIAEPLAIERRENEEDSAISSPANHGQAIANGPLESNCLSLNPAQAREGNAAPTMASIEGRPSRLR